ncbi:P-loop NTPase fold protein [Curtobacterium sp. MCPF17_021]|uniref:YobI family P-loop NTPase n=1 Tax=Curtobacterium sp. MCPF17_021 TaxID=2175639 RepID=UPI000DA6F9D6|nr:P-loop NTPase fold protein [Curtobacterium sp. MCPF17_021]WIE84428.1 P-loop NTPase fold protein [Curtobacterium sp. MCPF17_021]
MTNAATPSTPSTLASGPDDGVPTLSTLSATYEPQHHQLYYDLLNSAIGHPSSRNIALTGPYGSGKSSVLEKLRVDHIDRIVSISLSTIAPDLSDESDEPTVSARSNLIQKEIVKQLLYRLAPQRVPRSRFRRATVQPHLLDLLKATVVGGVIFLIAEVLGLVSTLAATLAPADSIPAAAVARGVIAAFCIGATWIVFRVAQARPHLDAALRAGPATVNLSRTSNYFDEYLDEIVYFFESSKRDIVVIEDIDRFDDARVFDTFRALNNLLNESEQIGSRIVFVYAIRDSIFETIGTSAAPTETKSEARSDAKDRAVATLEHASRTKFFDVIIPIVPFVSGDNARDVMTDAMTSPDFTINPALIRVAARHVPDMRLIRNLRNEFEVYRRRLILTPDRLPGIDDDLVFAIVVFKNTHASDFEAIQKKTSSLDTLYAVWRELVRQNARKQTTVINNLRIQQRNGAQARVVERLAQKYEAFIDDLTSSADIDSGRYTTTVESVGPLTTGTMLDPAAWRELASGTSQRVTLRNSRTNWTIELQFTADQLRSRLGVNVDPDAGVNEETLEQSRVAEADLEFLHHHTWEQLSARDDLTVDLTALKMVPTGANDLGPISFRTAVDAILESALAKELVRRGFIDSHFALYSSTFYGGHVSQDAMEYIRRSIEPGEPDASFSLSPEDVRQILTEQDATESDTAEFFTDPSVFNVSIVNYLIEHREGAACTVARRLARAQDVEVDFLETYVREGQKPDRLLALMTPEWSNALNFVARSESIRAEDRVPYLNIVLANASVETAAPDEHTAAVISDAYSSMSSITHPSNAAAARTVLTLLDRAHIRLTTLKPLSKAARREALRLRMFPLTPQNLRLLHPEGPIGLDTLRADEDLYGYVSDNLDTYLDMAHSRRREIGAVTSSQNFIAVLTDLSPMASAEQLDRIVASTPRTFTVDSLAAVPANSWPALAHHRRIPPTYTNVRSYIDEHGLDHHLGRIFGRRRVVIDGLEQDPAERSALAIELVNAATAIPSTALRVALAKSLKPGPLAPVDVQPEPGDLVARLLINKLLPDAAATFEPRLMTDWATLEATMAKSKELASFIIPGILPTERVAPALRSPAVPYETKQAVVKALPDWLSAVKPRHAEDMSRALQEHGWSLPPNLILALKTAGASPQSLIPIIAQSEDKVDIDDLRELLRGFGANWTRVANGGRGRPTFTVTESNRQVLQRLVGRTIKAVEDQAFKSGPLLVAPLR